MNAMRYLNAMKCAVAMSLLFGGGHSLAFSTNPPESVYAKTPQQDVAYRQGVSGQVAMLAHTEKGAYLLMAGGCNFPETPAAQGGAKRYYSEIYTAAFPSALGDSLHLDWSLQASLPEAMAYAAYVPCANSLVVAGGKSSKQDLRSVYRISLRGAGHVQIDSLPSLPAERSGMASAYVDGHLFLIGGAVAGKLSSSIISLDLDNPQHGWQERGHYPGKPFLKVLSAYYAPYLYVLGTFTDVEGYEGVGVNMTFQRYNIQTKVWEQLSLPSAELLNDVTFGGGYLFTEGDRLVLSGGVRSSRFLAALQREQSIRRARHLGQTSLADSLQAESRRYLSQPVEWHAFNGRTYIYDITTGAWSGTRTHNPDKRRADAAFVTLEQGGHILLGGELKPGIRTDAITIFPSISK